MKQLLFKITLFTVTILAFLVSILLLPPNREVRESSLFSLIRKDSLLAKTTGPRIIFIGGSSMSYGLNSALFKDSLRLHPVNTGIHAGLGLKFMLAHTLPFV